ncbi:hypothetical protein AALO_G00179050 [Alosa alosa]|uniref:Uncharacterized protein n=1 Tax=Alosa alosa TaxID=278164 RepID=A0AAV6G8W1_9TELE|nr:hypothetical protein AALO_G00179050 [Alosa alosa]
MGRKRAIALASLLQLFLTDLLATLDYQFAGIPQRDGALKFTLPHSIHAAVGHPSCDAQWDVDNATVAIITKDEITFDPSVKEVTHTSMTIDKCSSIVRYFVDCLEIQVNILI